MANWILDRPAGTPRMRRETAGLARGLTATAALFLVFLAAELVLLAPSLPTGGLMTSVSVP